MNKRNYINLHLATQENRTLNCVLLSSCFDLKLDHFPLKYISSWKIRPNQLLLCQKIRKYVIKIKNFPFYSLIISKLFLIILWYWDFSVSSLHLFCFHLLTFLYFILHVQVLLQYSRLESLNKRCWKMTDKIFMTLFQLAMLKLHISPYLLCVFVFLHFILIWTSIIRFKLAIASI